MQDVKANLWIGSTKTRPLASGSVRGSGDFMVLMIVVIMIKSIFTWAKIPQGRPQTGPYTSWTIGKSDNTARAPTVEPLKAEQSKKFVSNVSHKIHLVRFKVL